LEAEQGGRVEGRVAVVASQAVRAIGVFEAQAVEVGQGMIVKGTGIYRMNADVLPYNRVFVAQ